MNRLEDVLSGVGRDIDLVLAFDFDILLANDSRPVRSAFKVSNF